MQPEFCPFHRAMDTCVPVARMLAHAGLLDPAPNTPTLPGAVCGIGPVPEPEVTIALLAHRINVWGRVVIDPTLPHVDPTTADERSLRYTLQALREECTTRGKGFDILTWWPVGDALREAHSAADRTKNSRDEDDRALWWYLALRHLDRAHRVWQQHIGRPLSGTRDRTP